MRKALIPIQVIIILGTILLLVFSVILNKRLQNPNTPNNTTENRSFENIGNLLNKKGEPRGQLSSPLLPTIKPSPTSTPQVPTLPTTPPTSFTNAESFRDYILNTYGFNSNAQNFIKKNSYFTVKDLSSSCGGGGWRPWDKTVELNCAEHQAAVHELSHVWWHNRRIQNPEDAKGLSRDLIRLADGDGSPLAISFARGYVYGIDNWKGMYCTDAGCADVHNIKDSDFNLTESPSNAKINDWEIYAGLSSWTMGRFKTGPHALPTYLWKYFEPQFTGTILTTPYYEEGHP